MKLTKKILAVFLTILTLFSICSVAIPVLATYDTSLVTDGSVAEEEFSNPNEESPEPEIISEITEKREENVKHFMLSDGSFVVAQYNNPVHYQADSGEWIDIDNTVTETDAATEQTELFGTDELYATKKAVDNVIFAGKSNSNTLVSYEAKDYPISLNYQSAKKSNIQIIENNEELTGDDAFLTLPNVTQEVLYENVFTDVDLQYIVSPTGLKENIILKSKNAQNSFTVNYNIGELTAEVIDEQTINLMADNEIVYTISAPYMVDSNGEKSEAVTLNVDKNKNGKLRVNIVADSSWLQAEERIYPITVDPTITTDTDRDAIDSVMIAQAMPSANFSDQHEMIVGREASKYGRCRSLFKFDLPNLNKGDMVVSAKLKVAYYQYDVFDSDITDMQVNAHMLNGAWDLNNVTWSNCPSHESTVLDYEIFEKTPEYKTFDVSKAVKQWYETPTDNNGILLKSANEDDDISVNGFKASIWTERYNSETDYYPYLTITYRNNKGLEDYWTYTTFSAGTAGTAYVNDYTGNLVFIHGDVATTGLLMPVSLEHVYNGYVAGNYSKTYPHSGQGNKLSLQQTVTFTEMSDYPYMYEDGDGTQHYFYKDGSKYLDEDGLNLELKVLSGGGYTITDKADNVMTFDSNGCLKTIADAEGRKATLTYKDAKNASGNTVPFLTTITDGAGHKITLTYKIGSVDGDSQLTAITGPDGKTIRYYTSGGKRSQVTYPDGTCSKYTYDDDGSLKSAMSSDGYKLTFTYVNEDGAKRIRSVVESAGDETGQTVKFFRSEVNQTIIRSSGNDSVYGNDDDIRTTYQFDNYGRTLSTKTLLGDGTNMGAQKYSYTTGSKSGADDIGKRNRIAAGISIGKNVNNVLLNHSFENSNNWTGTYWLNTAYTDNGTAAFDSSQTYLGSKSVKIKVNSATKTGGRCMVQYVTNYVSSGTYTLSAYVKTDNLVMGTGGSIGGACVAARVVKADGSVTREYSRMLLGTTDSAVDNGWQRIHLTFDIPSGATDIRVVPMVYNATGTAYFDCMQLEKNNTVNSYNLLENTSFENGVTSWTAGNTTSNDKIDSGVSNGGSKSYKFAGNASRDKYIYQNVKVSGSEADTYVLSGYAKANSVPFSKSDDTNFFEINVKINYSDGSYIYKRPTFFNYAVSDWQHSTGVFTLSDNNEDTNKIPVSISVFCRYHKQINTCYFDDISLIKEPVPTYKYDSDGNLISATENAEKTANLSYDSNDNLTSFKDEKNAQYTYTYDEDHEHRLISAKNGASGVQYKYEYYGSERSNNLKAQEIVSGSGDYKIRTSTVYTPTADGIAGGAYVLRESNQHGYSTNYDYDLQSGRLKSVTDALNNKTTYTYNSNNGNLSSVASGSKTVEYSYDSSKTRLTGITHNGFNYNFTYDAFGNVKTTKVAGTTLMTNTYGPGNGLLTKSTYGNGDYVNYSYDELGRTTKIKKNGSDAYSWRYNANGDTAMHTDYVNSRVYYYTYDSLGRIVAETEKTQGEDEYRFASNYTYDISNNLTTLVNTADGLAVTTKYTFDDANRPIKSYLNSYVDHRYDYDTLGRLDYSTLKFKNDKTVKVDYTYANAAERSGDGVTYITSQISKEEIGGRGYAYTYDKVGNITNITEKKKSGGSYSTKASYTYDALGQLTSEINVDLGQKISYTYNAGGNIKTKKIYAYSDGTVGALQDTISYTYDGTWKDKLVTYDGDSITYDAIGNPKTYRDGMTFTWQGRQMKTAKTTSGTSVSYKYNADGLRTYKKVGSTVHQYEYSGDKLFYEKRGDIKFYYRYDVNGNLMSVTRLKANGDKFTLYAVCNSRGDVEELRKEDGTIYARYVYDSWGNVLHIYSGTGTTEITSTANLAVQNPFRYRGYYFDAESGLYYLQSRYYDPVTGRFVNPDSLVDNSDVLGFNMYAYCGNNPVSREDSGGNLWDTLFDIASVAYSAYQVCKDPTNLSNWASLAADVASLVIPGITGGGAAVRALTKADDVIDAAKAIDKVDDAVDAARAVDDTYDSVHAASNAVESVCFVAGTHVLETNGTKNIEDINIGDKVWATNPETGETELKEVVQTFINETDELVYVYAGDEEIVTTPEHPFYVSNHGWIGAIDLRAGDKLVLVNGEFAVVEKVQHEILEQPIKVYNFEVEDFHTYYVGDTGVLVHNACSVPKKQVKFDTRTQAFNAAKRDIGVPTSSQPIKVSQNIDKRGKVVPGRVYDFGNNRKIRDDVTGHVFNDGSHMGKHFNTSNGLHVFYE